MFIGDFVNGFILKRKNISHFIQDISHFIQDISHFIHDLLVY